MLISVIITTKNEEKNIENCLRSVLEQTYPRENIEIIVVDNFSTDRTAEIVQEFSKRFTPLNVKLFNRGPERSAQRNFGVEQSKGEYFIYLDADMILEKNVIRDCVEKIKNNPEIIALYVSEIVMGEKFFSQVRRFERSFYDGTAIDGVRFIKKEKFMEVGCFDERMYACEDWDLTKKLKKAGKTDLVSSVIYHNEEEFNLRKYLGKKGYYSKNMNLYLEKWGESDPDLKKQFGLSYRFFGVFVENGKWKKLLSHPLLACGMYFLRIMVGIKFLIK